MMDDAVAEAKLGCDETDGPQPCEDTSWVERDERDKRAKMALDVLHISKGFNTCDDRLYAAAKNVLLEYLGDAAPKSS